MINKELAPLAIPLKHLHPHPQNVRQGDIGALTESLKHHGQYRPIVVQKRTNYILAGNHTFKAAKALGWKEIAATFVDCDDEQALRILLVDNRANDLATYDDAALVEVLKQLSETDISLDGTLFDGDDLDELIVKLEGIHGFVVDTQPFSESVSDYEQRGIGVLSLPYDKETLQHIKQKLTTLQNGDENITFSDIVASLVANAYENISR